MTEAQEILTAIARYQPYPAEGRVLRLHAGGIEADGPDLSVGMLCTVEPRDRKGETVVALVASVSRSGIVLVPFSTVAGLKVGDIVKEHPDGGVLPAGDAFCGRAVNALAQPIDQGGEIKADPARSRTLAVLDRVAPNQILPTGIRAIDGLLTLGRGQRMGIFAASGVGKTRLIGQILNQTPCDRLVVCLVGERGREVEEFWSALGQNALEAKVSLVAATSDESAPMRARAVDQALALAEHWRDRGEHVLLVVDSITRLAMALREIGLVAGEPPTVRAYTPNVFRELPRIVEACGASRKGGSITALFTVLSETDDADDPLVEVMKSLLDGHILLSRQLAQAGHYPAIDISRSISRLFDQLTDRPQRAAAAQCRVWLAKIEESRILVESGMYKAGGDKVLDAALANRDHVDHFLRQSLDEGVDFAVSRGALLELVNDNAAG